MHIKSTTCSGLLVLICVMHCLALDEDCARADDGVVMQRIRSDKTLTFYYGELGESGRTLIAKLDECSLDADAIPSRSETIRILAESEVELSVLERLSFETILRRMQRSPVTREVLFATFQAFSQTVPPVNCTYHATARVAEQGGDKEQDALRSIDCQFSYSADKSTFFSKSGDLFSGNVVRVTWIFDGVEMREIEEAREGLSNEFVYVPPNLRSLYPEYHPFTAARIAPEEAVQDPNVRQHSGFAVFENDAAVVFESRENHAGKELLAVGFLDWVVLLDPLLDYAIVEERFGDLDFRGKYVRTTPHHKKQNSDFVKLGDGACVPRRSVIEQWRKGRFYKHVETTVDSLEVRPKHSLEEAFVRPKRLHVANDITGESHLSSSVKPAGAVDIESDNPSSSFRYVWLVVGVVAGFIIVLCVWYSRKGRSLGSV